MLLKFINKTTYVEFIIFNSFAKFKSQDIGS